MLWRCTGYLFASMSMVSLVGAAAVAYVIWNMSRDLPDYEQLALYEPPITTRVHAADGSLLAEYAKERRLYLPVDAIPKLLIKAFLAAEDKNFYWHSGVDYESVAAALLINLRNFGTGRRPVGGSTITQQVAKNFLLNNEVSYERKLKEALLALKIEQTFDKDQILELYLNEIYLGSGSYGVAAASLNYFGKSVAELDLQEMAYLAALPKAPNNYHPFRATARATARRNWVINQMRRNGFIGSDAAEQARAAPLEVTLRSVDPHMFAADYFAEEIRRVLYAMYGERKLYEGGLSVRATLDPEMQIMARKALVDGLVSFDRMKGWRGPVDRIAVAPDWASAITQIPDISDVAPWRMGVVIAVNNDQAEIGLRPAVSPSGGFSAERETVKLNREGVAWTGGASGKNGRSPAVRDILRVGDVVYVAPNEAPGGRNVSWELMQIPEVEGAIVAMDPHTGRVKALVGGFSYSESEFNRATQALRQPGSAFKPFVYAAALDNGYMPSSIVIDAPLEIEQGPGLDIWRPRNYGRVFYGPSTLRLGIEKSRNVMTVRLARDIGMPLVREYAERFGIYDHLLPVLAMSLGAGETTLLRMTAAYAMLDNGGKKVTPTLIDRIQDRWGRTIFRHDKRECTGCDVDSWNGRDGPVLIDHRPQILDPHTAYQMTSMLEGVVQRGTGAVVRSVKKPLAGKTGTTNDERDTWFIGYSPDLTVGVFVGYDKPRSMGKGSTGGRVAAPIFRDFMAMALSDKPAIPFRVPEGINLFRVDAKTGLKASINDKNAIMEAFKPGRQPSRHSVIDYSNYGRQDGLIVSPQPFDDDISPGAGGLY